MSTRYNPTLSLFHGDYPDITGLLEALAAHPTNLLGLLADMGIACQPEDEPIIPKTDRYTVPASMLRASSKIKHYSNAEIIAPITQVLMPRFLIGFVNQCHAEGILPDYVMYLCNLVWEADQFTGAGLTQLQRWVNPQTRTYFTNRSEVIAFFLTMYLCYGQVNRRIQYFVQYAELVLGKHKLLYTHFGNNDFELVLVGHPDDSRAKMARVMGNQEYEVRHLAAFQGVPSTQHHPPTYYLFNEKGEEVRGNAPLPETGKISTLPGRVFTHYQKKKLNALIGS